ELHLLKSPDIANAVSNLQGKGSNRVEKVKYDEKEKKIYINPGQYFEGIEANIWQYQIGGYQVCDKWLKDRKGKVLSLNDIKHYCMIVSSLTKTIKIQKSIDDFYAGVEKDIIEIELKNNSKQ
ncbi:MAG: DNA methyltransferase, partial [Nitrospirae bacterium]|nr:DNA methyltransferase [Nitrospirota bacterium]